MLNFNYSVKTKIRTDKKRKNGTCPIVIHVYVNGKTVKFFLKGESIKPNHWDKTKCRAKNKGSGMLNDLIDKKEEEVKDYLRKNKLQGTIPTKKNVQDFWNGVGGYNDKFFDFYEDFYKRHLKDKTEVPRKQ